MKAARRLVLLSCLLWGACVRFGFGSGENRPVDLGGDGAVTGDGGQPDGPATVDLDRRKADLPSKVDSPSRPDSPWKLDKPPAEGPFVGAACNPSFAVVEKTFSAGMVVCRSSSAQSYSQCQAGPKLCAAGWQLCPASGYRTRFASSGPGLPESAWLAGCIREGGATSAPIDGTCSTCGGATAPFATFDWSCDGATGNGGTVPHVGVTSAESCLRVGLNDPAAAAYWGHEAAAFPLGRAFCCK